MKSQDQSTSFKDDDMPQIEGYLDQVKYLDHSHTQSVLPFY